MSHGSAHFAAPLVTRPYRRPPHAGAMTFCSRRIIAIVAVLLAMLAAVPARACTVTSALTSNVGPYSPPAVKAGAVPPLYAKAGLNCLPSVIVLLGMNYIRAKFSSQNNFKLLNGANVITYTASPDAGATVAFTQNGTVDYMQNNLLNILGLLGGSSADFPIYIKPGAATLPPEGVYSDKITITWNWYLCQGVNALFICLGTPDSGINVVTVVDVKLTVTARQMTISTVTTTTWDAISGTWRPKALPGSRQRVATTVANPDIIAIDSNTVQLGMALPARARIALDGDMSGASDFVRFTDGSPASTVTLSYVSPASTTDDVDFSADGGTSWTYYPVAGNEASQAAVTNIRLRPRGAMSASSSFVVSYPIAVK